MSISARFGISAVALLRALMCAAIVALIALGGTTQTTAALGRPGVTPVPCPDQAWQISEASFDALPGAKVSFSLMVCHGACPARRASTAPWTDTALATGPGGTCAATAVGSSTPTKMPITATTPIRPQVRWAQRFITLDASAVASGSRFRLSIWGKSDTGAPSIVGERPCVNTHPHAPSNRPVFSRDDRHFLSTRMGARAGGGSQTRITDRIQIGHP